MYRKNLNIKYKSEMVNQKFERKVKSNTIVHIKVEKYIRIKHKCKLQNMNLTVKLQRTYQSKIYRYI